MPEIRERQAIRERPIRERAVSSDTPTPTQGMLSRYGAGLWESVNPIPAVKAVFTDPVGTVVAPFKAQYDTAKKGYQAAKEGRLSEAAGYGAAAMMPLVGPAAAQAGETIGTGDVARGMGQATGLIGGMLLGGKVAKKPEIVTNTAGAIRDIPGAIRRTLAPEKSATVMDMAKSIPPRDRFALDKINRVAAPTGKKVGFRDSLNEAHGDLVEIAQKTDISPSAGGIVNPDYRPRAFVNAIDDHLKLMHETELVPQIQRHAANPVPSTFSADANQGLAYLSRNAGEVAGQQLAKQAMEANHIPLGAWSTRNCAGSRP